MPDVNVVDMADYEAGFAALLNYRDQLRDQARQGTLTATDADVMDAIRGNSDAMVAINFLKRVFGDFDKAGKFSPRDCRISRRERHGGPGQEQVGGMQLAK